VSIGSRRPSCWARVIGITTPAAGHLLVVVEDDARRLTVCDDPCIGKVGPLLGASDRVVNEPVAKTVLPGEGNFSGKPSPIWRYFSVDAGLALLDRTTN